MIIMFCPKGFLQLLIYVYAIVKNNMITIYIPIMWQFKRVCNFTWQVTEWLYYIIVKTKHYNDVNFIYFKKITLYVTFSVYFFFVEFILSVTDVEYQTGTARGLK